VVHANFWVQSSSGLTGLHVDTTHSLGSLSVENLKKVVISSEPHSSDRRQIQSFYFIPGRSKLGRYRGCGYVLISVGGSRTQDMRN
jgi:hypothetical protein